MFFLIGGISVAAIVSTVAFIIYRVRTETIEEALKQATNIAEKHSNEVAITFEKGFSYARALRTAIEGQKENNDPVTREEVYSMFRETVKENNDFYGIWSVWEPNKFDGKDSDYTNANWHDESGRMKAYVHKDNNMLDIVEGHTGDPNNGYWYKQPFTTGKDYMDGPASYNIGGKKVLMVSLTTPLKLNNERVGVLGVDYELTKLSEEMGKIKPWDTGYLEIINDKGVYIAHPDPALAGKNMFENDPTLKHLKKNINQNSIHIERGYSKFLDKDVYRIMVPLHYRGTNQNGAVIVSVPTETIMASTNELMKLATVIGVIACLILFGAITLFTFQISSPIAMISQTLESSAQEVSSASSLVSDTSTRLAQNNSEQVSHLQETCNATEQVTQMTKQNADDAQEANQKMSSAERFVTEANAHINELTKSMDDISTSSEETKKIIGTIDEIAFQTNILALNAAVEAARAGEAGAGFAVVSEEVRNLASRAAEAARNTTALIEGSVTKINIGNQLVNKVSNAMKNVTGVTEGVSKLINKISSATDQQKERLIQINDSISDIDTANKENAASSEESAAAAQQLNAQSMTMSSMVTELDRLIKGH